MIGGPDKVVLNSVVTLDDAERIVRLIGVGSEFIKPLELDLTNAKTSEIGAGTRIGNALRRYHSNLTVRIPPANGTTISNYIDDHWHLLETSHLGLAVAAHAHRVEAGTDDITRAFREHFSPEKPRISHTLVVVPGLHLPGTPTPEERDSFATYLISLLNKLRVPAARFDGEALDQLIELTREAVLNIRDHSTKTPLAADTAIQSYLSLSYHPPLDRVSGAVEPLRYYIRNLKRKFTRQQVTGFLEIAINDDGVGVAARQSQREAIYWAAAPTEELALLAALQRGGSVKPIAKDAIARGDPGYGFSVIAQSLRRLNGFASMRTGKYLVVCDGTRYDPMAEGFKVASGRTSSQLGYLPGTLIQALVPVIAD